MYVSASNGYRLGPPSPAHRSLIEAGLVEAMTWIALNDNRNDSHTTWRDTIDGSEDGPLTVSTRRAMAYFREQGVTLQPMLYCGSYPRQLAYLKDGVRRLADRFGTREVSVDLEDHLYRARQKGSTPALVRRAYEEALRAWHSDGLHVTAYVYPAPELHPDIPSFLPYDSIIGMTYISAKYMRSCPVTVAQKAGLQRVDQAIGLYDKATKRASPASVIDARLQVTASSCLRAAPRRVMLWAASALTVPQLRPLVDRGRAWWPRGAARLNVARAQARPTHELADPPTVASAGPFQRELLAGRAYFGSAADSYYAPPVAERTDE